MSVKEVVKVVWGVASASVEAVMMGYGERDGLEQYVDDATENVGWRLKCVPFVLPLHCPWPVKD